MERLEQSDACESSGHQEPPLGKQTMRKQQQTDIQKIENKSDWRRAIGSNGTLHERRLANGLKMTPR